MTRFIALTAACLLGLAACSSDAATSSSTNDASTSSVDGTTTVATTTEPTGATTSIPAAPTTSAGPATTTPGTAPPATPAPTAAPTAPPTTAACRTVNSLYDLPDVSSVNVRRGDCGQGVRDVQDQLNYKLGISLTLDGRFGPGTEGAVRDFQALVGLPVDGIVGPMTWVALTDDDVDPDDV